MRNVAPTKSQQMKLKQELSFAQLGYELLDQKRNILVLELLSLVDQAVDYQQRVEKSLAEAYRMLSRCSADMGQLQMSRLASAVFIESDITLSQRRVMGVMLPVVDTTFRDHAPYYSPKNTSAWVDASIREYKHALSMMGHLAELKVSIMRLAEEVKTTIRKVHALDRIAIPELQDTVKFIDGRLEEHEREMFIRMKRVKQMLTKQEERHGTTSPSHPGIS